MLSNFLKCIFIFIFISNCLKSYGQITEFRNPFLQNVKNKAINFDTLSIKIQYQKASNIAKLIRLTKKGKIKVDHLTNTIWIFDTQSNILRARRFIKELDVPVRQVLIEARMVNIFKNHTLDLGTRLGISKLEPFHGTMENLPILDRMQVDLSAVPLGVAPGLIGITLAKLGRGMLLDMELSALESQGQAQIMASPRLITTDKKSALIESGEDIPYQETTVNGSTAVTFRKAVLSLKVTPEIMAQNMLRMNLKISQEGDSGRRVQGVPIVLTKAIQTQVLMRDGETIVLGGVDKQSKQRTIMKVPILGSLPIIGHLFRRVHRHIQHEELFIFITPKIVR